MHFTSMAVLLQCTRGRQNNITTDHITGKLGVVGGGGGSCCWLLLLSPKLLMRVFPATHFFLFSQKPTLTKVNFG